MDRGADQRRRNEPEERQRRIASADVWIVLEAGAEGVLSRQFDERAPGIGDRDELLAADERVEVLEQRQRLDRAARLGRDDEQRVLELDLVLGGRRDGRRSSSREQRVYDFDDNDSRADDRLDRGVPFRRSGPRAGRHAADLTRPGSIQRALRTTRGSRLDR